MVKVCIYFTFGEAQPDEIIVNPGVPSTGCMFQSIQCSLDFAHMLLSIKGLKSFWFLNLHLFLNHSIEECFLHIHLMYIPSHLRCKS